MAKPLQLVVFMLTGLLLGLGGSLFDAQSMRFQQPTLAHFETFPYASFVPGLAIGLCLGAVWRARWGELWGRVIPAIRNMCRGVDVLIAGLVCLIILIYV